MVAQRGGDEDGSVASPTLTDAGTQASRPAPGTIDAIYDAPYIVFVYAAWAGSSWLVGDTIALAVLIAGTAALTTAGLIQRAPFRSHSFAADLATILLFCGAAIGAGWFVVQGLAAAPLVTVLGLGATAAATIAIAMSPAAD